MSDLNPVQRAEARYAIAGLVGDVALHRAQPTDEVLDEIVETVATTCALSAPLLPPAPQPEPSVLVELSVAEVARFAEVVRARIMHPSHTPVQAVRAGLAVVNGMRLDAAAAPVHELAARRPAAPRKVSRLGVAERGAVWEDVDGDRWRWCWASALWQYRPLGGEAWYPCPSDMADQAPSSRYAPFTEVRA